MISRRRRQWLDHLRLSSVRLNDGGSGSFVSPDGLLLTNHHVARGQLQKNSTAEHDYVRDGFYAATPDQEMKSPDLEVNVLVAHAGCDRPRAGRSQGHRRRCEGAEGARGRDRGDRKGEQGQDRLALRRGVVLQGGEYWLYQYKAYTDVRLVFAPEQQAAFLRRRSG